VIGEFVSIPVALTLMGRALRGANVAGGGCIYVARRDFLVLKYGRHGARFRKTKRTTWGRVR
jgi:hypothetical protein